MSKETKFGYGFLLAGVGLPYLIERFFGQTAASIAASVCLLLGICLLIAGHLHERQGIATKIIFALLALAFIGGGIAWRLSREKPSKHESDQVGRIENLLGEVPDASYRQLVASVIYAFEPHSSLSVGALEHTPDGARKIDIEIRSVHNGKPFLTAIDVIDLPLGRKADINAVDAADSKRADIKADTMLLCSNTGFEADAIHKAKRAKIGLISVLRQGDQRIKAVIEEEIYLGRVRLESLQNIYTAPSVTNWHHGVYEMTYKGGSLDAWLQIKAALIVAINPELTKAITDTFTFKRPTYFDTKHGPVLPKSIGVSFVPQVKWLTQVVQIDAKAGIYDYVRGHVKLTESPDSYTIKGINFDTATPLISPPPLTDMSVGLMPGEVDFQFVLVDGGSPPKGITVADIDDLVRPEDLNLKIPPKEFRRLFH